MFQRKVAKKLFDTSVKKKNVKIKIMAEQYRFKALTTPSAGEHSNGGHSPPRREGCTHSGKQSALPRRAEERAPYKLASNLAQAQFSGKLSHAHRKVCTHPHKAARRDWCKAGSSSMSSLQECVTCVDLDGGTLPGSETGNTAIPIR